MDTQEQMKADLEAYRAQKDQATQQTKIITAEELKQQYGSGIQTQVEENKNESNFLQTLGTVGLIVGIIISILVLVFIVFPYLLGIAVRMFKKASK